MTLQRFPAPGSTSHSASVERIGSCYTPSAIGLSMVAAKKVGDKMNLSSPTKNSTKGRSRKKQAVVAPAAFEQMSAVNMGMGNQSYDDDEGVSHGSSWCIVVRRGSSWFWGFNLIRRKSEDLEQDTKNILN